MLNFIRPLFCGPYMGCVATKSVCGVSDKARLKPVSSATETRLKIEISLVVCLNMILSIEGITKALISLEPDQV